MKTALTIAGSDSSGGAGIQGDLKVFSALGIHGTSVVTAVTAQNTKGVQKIEYLSENIISEQIDSVLCDIQIDAVKTGMLCMAKIVSLVYRKLKKYKIENLVVDPVMVSTSGTELLELSDLNSLKNLKKLIEISKIATPNVYEAEILSGVKIKNSEDMKSAAEKIGNCIITGGDFNYNNDKEGNDNNINEIIDLLFFDNTFHTFKNKKIGTGNNIGIHGTGCAFSAAVTSGLAKGCDVFEAVENAEKFTSDLIEHSFSIGRGNGLKIMNPNINLNINSEKFSAVKSIQKAVEKLISDENSYKLAPQVGINIAMALPCAAKIEDVAGISGRIVRNEKKLVPVGDIKFGGSSHVGRVVLTAMKFDAETRAAMNIKFSSEILKICRELNLTISSFDRSKQPEDTKTMEWGTKAAIHSLGYVPNIIYDKGGFGKEAMVRILGKTASEVVDSAIKIGKSL